MHCPHVCKAKYCVLLRSTYLHTRLRRRLLIFNAELTQLVLKLEQKKSIPNHQTQPLMWHRLSKGAGYFQG